MPTAPTHDRFDSEPSGPLLIARGPRLARGFLTTLVLLAFTACSTEDPGGTGPEVETDDLAQVLLSAGAFEEVEDAFSETEPEEFEETSGGEQYFCTRQAVSLTPRLQRVSAVRSEHAVVFPGNLLQGNTLDNATPSGIPVERGPGTVVITLVNGASSASRQLGEVSLSSVYDAMNEIIAGNPGDLPARTTYSMERITSREQLGVSIRAEYHNLTTEVQGSFDYRSDVSYNRYLVQLTQSYYTIAFEAPTNTADFFGDGLEVASDPDFTVPIELFSGARMGVADEDGFNSGVGTATIEIREYQIYDFVPTDAQRRRSRPACWSGTA